jgi:hypothetical protein
VQDQSLLNCFKAGLHGTPPRASRKWVIIVKIATKSGHPPSLIHPISWKVVFAEIAEKVLEVAALLGYAHTFAGWHHADGNG